MLLDEKESEAEAHEAEKDALWRRIEDMATRVAELEQESAEARSLCQEARTAGEGNDHLGFAPPEGIFSPRSSPSGAEDAILRAKNDVLERQLDMIRDQLEETKLELSAARKAQLYYKRASQQSCGGRSRSPSLDRRREHESSPASSDGAPGRVVTPPIVGGTLARARAAGVSVKVSPLARPAAEKDDHGFNSAPPKVPKEAPLVSNKIHDNKDEADNCRGEPEGFEEDIEMPQSKDMPDDLDAPRLLEQNASLMVELDSKDELIEALRQQLKQQQYMPQQRGIRGRCTFSSRYAMEELGKADSDDDCGDENEDPDPGACERSFMDDLLDEAGGNHNFATGRPSIDAPGTDDSENLKEEAWGADLIRQPAPERRRSFGGVLQENISLVLSSRKDATPETVKIADWGTKRAQQGKSPRNAGREKSQFRGKKPSSTSPPPRRRRRSLDRASGRGPSPVASSRHEARGLTGAVGQSLTGDTAPPLAPMTTGAMETWPASPRGVPLSWSSAMRALGVFTHLGGQQEQPEAFDVKIAELGVAVDEQQPSTPSPEMKEQQGVEGARAPPKEDNLSSAGEQESTTLASVDTEAAMEEQDVEMEGDKFPAAETHASVSPWFIVKPEVAITKVVKGAKALDVEENVLPVVAKGDESTPEEEQAPTPPESVEPDTMVIEKVKGVSEPPSPSPAASSCQEAGGVTGVEGQSLTIATAPPLASTMTAGALETWPGSPRDVPLSWSSAMRALAAVARVGGQEQQQPEASEVKIAEQDVAVEESQASAPSEKMKEQQGLEGVQAPVSRRLEKKENVITKHGMEDVLPPAIGGDEVTPEEQRVSTSLASVKLEAAKKSLVDAQAPPKEDDKLSSGVKQESTPLTSVGAGAAVEEQEMESDEFPTVEKHESVSPKFIVKPEAAMTEVAEGPRALDVEGDMLPVVVKGDEPTPEEEQEPTPSESVETDTMVIDKIDSVSKPPSPFPLPPRRRCRSLDLAKGPDPSPAASSRQEAEDVAGVVGQSLTIAAVPPLDPTLAMTAGALQTWPGSPRGVPLSWSSAMRALAAVARVGGQKQLDASEVEMAELDVAVGWQVKNESVTRTKNEVEIQAPVKVGEKSPSSFFPSAEGNESISPGPAKVAMIREKEVEDIQPPAVEYDRATTCEQSSKLEATEKRVVDTQAPPPEDQLSSAEAAEGDEYPISEKHEPASSELIVKREAATAGIVEDCQALDVEEEVVPSKKGGELPESEQGPTTPISVEPDSTLVEEMSVQKPAVEGNNFSAANGQEPICREFGKPEAVVKVEMGDPQPAPAAEGDEFSSAEEQTLTSPASVKLEAVVKEEVRGVRAPAVGDGEFLAIYDQKSTSSESVKPEAAIVKLEQQLPAVEDGISSSASKQESTSQAPVVTEAVKAGHEMENAKASAVDNNGFPPSAQGKALTSPKSAKSDKMAMEETRGVQAPVVKHDDFDKFPFEQGQAPTSPASVMEEKVWNDQAPDVAGRKFSSAEVQVSASPAYVKAPAVTDDGLPTEEQPSSTSPASVKPADKVRGIQGPVVKAQERPARPAATEEAQPLATATAGPRDLTRNRAERKSRQAMAKLGLRAVSGVFRVTMKASNGDLLVVEKPDVFKHPQQSKYVIFGTADMEKSGGERYPTAWRVDAAAFSKPPPAKCPLQEVPKNPSGADRAAVEDRSASAGIDPADVLTVVSHTGCDSDAAIEALRQEGGDVVNAVMYLTEA